VQERGFFFGNGLTFGFNSIQSSAAIPSKPVRNFLFGLCGDAVFAKADNHREQAPGGADMAKQC
jgi:hypothetical protein